VGHLTLCFIAYYCEALMTQALREKKLMLGSSAIDSAIIDPRPLTVVEAMRELQEVRAVPVKVHSTTIWVRTDINGIVIRRKYMKNDLSCQQNIDV
jgi:hypothetical protein